MTQETNYPIDGQVRIVVEPEKTSDFTIALRIPAWSERTVVSVNGEPLTDLLAGAYLPIHRTWEKGDEITVELDMRARLVELNEAQAIVRGPLVLARDSRFKDGDVDEASVIVSKDGYVELTPVQAPDFAWMAFTVPMVLGTDWKETARLARFICAISHQLVIRGIRQNVIECGYQKHGMSCVRLINLIERFTPAQCVRSLNSEGVTPSFFLKNVENWPAFSKCRL